MRCREIIPLAIPRHPIRYAALPMMKRVVGTVERLTRAVPFGERGAIAVGMQYWDRGVETGLKGATYEFPLPKALANVAA